jgi:dihydropteroate synthase
MNAPPPLPGLPLSFERPLLMGILNITPDSFSDGGKLIHPHVALERARRLVADGAHLLDVGGESTRPGAPPVSAAEELARVVPVLDLIRGLGVPISIDTSKAEVAAAALSRGASIVNDVTALSDPEMAPLCAERRCAVILMHMRGTPRTMQEGEIVYDDVVRDVRDFLAARVEAACAAGIARDSLLVDPGIGFGKRLPHNLALTRGLGAIAELGRPVVYGASRKRFLGEITGRPVEERDRATAAACVAAVLAGAHVLRVHDVAAVRDAVLVAEATRGAAP